MADWQEFKAWVASKYVLLNSGDNFFVLEFSTGAGRKQIVTVQIAEGTQFGVWAILESAIGKTSDINLKQVTDLASRFAFGGITTDGDLISLRHSVPLASLDPNEFDVPVRIIAQIADDLERGLHAGTDQY